MELPHDEPAGGAGPRSTGPPGGGGDKEAADWAALQQALKGLSWPSASAGEPRKGSFLCAMAGCELEVGDEYLLGLWSQLAL